MLTKNRTAAFKEFLSDPQIREAIESGTIFELLPTLNEYKAQELRAWLNESAKQLLREQDNPELAIVRTREAYARAGYDRQWIDQRIRSVSARHELTSEWFRRGIREGEQFRALTNEMMRAAFGFDVETYRRYKGLFRSGHHLRDHMTDLELSLLSLGETTAAELHRTRRSNGFDALLSDAKDAGRVIKSARHEIEGQLGRPVVSASNHLRSIPTPPPRPASAGRIDRDHLTDLAA